MIGNEAFFVHRRERLSSLLSADMELTQCLISWLLNRQMCPRRNNKPVCDKPIRATVGSLTWLGGMTRPDIGNAVRAVARQAHDLAERHWRAVKKIIPYLNKTKDLGLVFVKYGDRKLSAYVCM